MAFKRLSITLALGLALALVLLWALGGSPFPSVYAATLTVTTFSDDLLVDGNCSLREAIAAANTDTTNGECTAGSGPDTILLGSGTYTLTLAGSGEDGNATGDLDVTETLTITGLGPMQTVIDGNGLDRVLDLHPGAGTVVISGVTILNGSVNGNGAGIRNNDAMLTLINTAIVDSSAVNGGGIYGAAGAVELVDSQVLSNTASNLGGGVCLYGTGAVLTMTGGAVGGNTSGNIGGGIYANSASTSIDGGRALGNQGFSGGGLYLASTSATVSGTQILSNTATHSGGGIYVYGTSATLLVTGNAVIAYNTAAPTAGGGGIYINTGSVTVNSGQVSTNTARFGGGLFVSSGNATLTVRGGEMRGNQAENGGGIHVDDGHATIAGGQIVHNTASADGGGVYVDVGQVTLNGGQIAYNVATDDGGGAYVGWGQVTLEGGQVLSNTALDVGGGVHVEDGTATLSGTQVISNLAPFGGGVFVDRGLVTVLAGEISSNTAAYGGGGLCVYGGSAQVDGGAIASNTAGAGGGLLVYDAPVTVSGGEIRGNTAITCGGGVFVALPTSAFTQTGSSTIQQNTAGAGGGVCAFGGSTVLSGGLVLGNTAYTFGGGIYVYSATARLQVSGTQILSNIAGNHGGGLYNLDGAVALVNTTVSGNSATAGAGGALYVSGGTTVLTYTTVASNTTASGGDGIHNSGEISSLLLANTLLAHNSPANCGGTLGSNGSNLSDDGSCVLVTGDITGTPALIGSLSADGDTLIHALLEGSPAVDAATCAAGITTDQRGHPRPDPVSSFCDIGAYESAYAGTADLLITKVATPVEVAPGGQITYVLTFTNAGTSKALDIVITDTMPASITVHAVISNGVAITEAGPGYTWQVENLARGQGGVITLTGSLTEGVPAGTLTNIAAITATTADSLPGNNQSQVQVTVIHVEPYRIFVPVVLRGYP